MSGKIAHDVCNRKLTIALNGNWGTDKSSIKNMAVQIIAATSRISQFPPCCERLTDAHKAGQERIAAITLIRNDFDQTTPIPEVDEQIT